MKFEKVLIVSKMTELEFYETMYGANVDSALKKYNYDVSALEKNHKYHYESLDKIIRLFELNGIKAGVIKKQSIGRMDFDEKWDLIVPVGGDGTFMDVGRYILDDTFLFGIKSSPISAGCHYNTDFSNAEEHIAKLLKGDFKIEKRARIEGVIENGDYIKDFALNEIAIGDRYFAGYSRLNIEFNGETFVTGSNGLVVSTYRGRTGWYDYINIMERDSEIVQKAKLALTTVGLGDCTVNNSLADFKMGEENLIRYKVAIGHSDHDKNYGYDFGILRQGEELIVHSRIISDGAATFDGSKPGRPRSRTYNLYFGSKIRLRMSDKPLYVVQF
ncbi:MAG: NAD(+)/NADH kinase [Nanoarchaeota archaeon]|nr:NAD(+)/NADH kinase [Nanoarchaeota archaeon]MBU1269949.1 NAD(+)/NADH kinase [Nanoarchaeota archaeon]MBU1604040.1 NAD(+)/NADH kinase [Nanoarchaeota archaeon]